MAKTEACFWKFKILFFLIFIFLVLNFAFAHCPLCTAGAGIGAIIAKELGMKVSAIGVFIGAFAVALGWWLANILRKKINFKFLTAISIIISYLTIVLPLKLYFYEIGSFYLNLFGNYGTLFNRTYTYDRFLLTSILGGLIIIVSPLLSQQIIKWRQGKIFPYQGLVITFLLLVFLALFFQFQ
jgi:hypothetical protein